MIEYIFLSLYFVLVSILFKRKKNLLFILTFVPLLLFFGTRVDFGADYDSYLEQYDRHHDWSFDQYIFSFAGGKFEPGYFLLEKIFPSFNSLIFACTVLLLVPVAIFFYEFIPKEYYPLAFILFLFNPGIFDAIIAMRSGVVVGLFLLAVVLKYRGYRILPIALAVLSGTFHMSGYLLIPFFLLTDRFLKRNYRLLCTVVITLIVLALLSSTLFGDLIFKISESYQEASVYNGHIVDTGAGLGFYLFSIIRTGFVIYILSLLKRGVVSDKFIWIVWLTVFDYFFYMIQGIDIMYRFVYYFYVTSIFFKCYVLRDDKSIASRVYVGLSILYLCYAFVAFASLEQTQRYFGHYKSFLF